MKQVFDSIQSVLDALPDAAFTGKWDYTAWEKLQTYIRGRRNDAMAPVRARQELARVKAYNREQDLENRILVWYYNKGKDFLQPGTRIKLKGTRDAGYRKIHSFNGEQVIGFQFFYNPRVRSGKVVGRITVDEDSTTF